MLRSLSSPAVFRCRTWGGIYVCTYDGELTLQEEEVQAVLLMSPNEIFAREREFTGAPPPTFFPFPLTPSIPASCMGLQPRTRRDEWCRRQHGRVAPAAACAAGGAACAMMQRHAAVSC